MSSESSSQTASTSSPNLNSMLYAALNEYKKNIGKDLQALWLAAETKSCGHVDGVVEIVRIVRGHTTAFERSGERQLIEYIDPLVHVLYAFSDAFRDGVGLEISPAKVVVTGIGVLLGVAKDVKASHSAIIGLFERIENDFMRLQFYTLLDTQILLTTQMEEVFVKIVIELLSILSIATKEVKRPLAKLFAKKLLGKTDIEDALKKLGSLIEEEHELAWAQFMDSLALPDLKDGSDKT